MVYVKFHNMKRIKISNIAVKLKLIFFYYFFNYSQQNKTILTTCPQLKFTKFKQIFIFSFVQSMHCLFFLKMFVFFFLYLFFMLCSTVFKFLFFFSFF